MASQTEDRLLEVLKAVGARVDSAVGTFTNLSTFGRVEQSEVGHTPQIFPLFTCVQSCRADVSCKRSHWCSFVPSCAPPFSIP